MKSFDEIVIDALKSFVREEHSGNVSSASRALNLEPGTGLLNKWLSGERTPTIKSISPILSKIGLEVSNATLNAAVIQRTQSHSPIELVTGDNLITIPVYDLAGAGLASDFSEMEPLTFLPILEQYVYQDVFAVQVIGDSMEPLIKKGAFVGVTPFKGELVEGGIYLVQNRYFGLVVKRIKQDSQGRLVLFSENTKYEPQTLESSDDPEHLIKGQVVWVWQLV